MIRQPPAARRLSSVSYGGHFLRRTGGGGATLKSPSGFTKRGAVLVAVNGTVFVAIDNCDETPECLARFTRSDLAIPVLIELVKAFSIRPERF